MTTSFFYIYAMATSFFYIYLMATSFFYIYVMTISFLVLGSWLTCIQTLTLHLQIDGASSRSIERYF